MAINMDLALMHAMLHFDNVRTRCNLHVQYFDFRITHMYCKGHAWPMAWRLTVKLLITATALAYPLARHLSPNC